MPARQATLPTLQRLLRAAGYEVRLVLVPTEGDGEFRRAEPETRRKRDERAR